MRAGGAPPSPEPASPADLRRCWVVMLRIQAEHPSPAAGAVGIDIRLLEAGLPGVDVAAIWLRVAFLHILRAQGALKEWEHGSDLDDAVFQVAATFPFGGHTIEVESFREQLRAVSRY